MSNPWVNQQNLPPDFDGWVRVNPWPIQPDGYQPNPTHPTSLIVTSGITKVDANGQSPISFRDLFIVIFINKSLPSEVLLLQNFFLFRL
jgi:hypothetical protein